MQPTKDHVAETSPLLSSPLQQQQQQAAAEEEQNINSDHLRVEAIAEVIVSRSLSIETDTAFSKEDILGLLTEGVYPLDGVVSVEEAAIDWIRGAAASGTVGIVEHNQDEEILHILEQQTSNLTNQPSTSQGTTSGMGAPGTRPMASDTTTSSVSSHSSHSKRSRKKKRP